MTCFRRKEGPFVLTAQRSYRRVPVLHRIPLFSRTRMRVHRFLAGSRICHKISRFSICTIPKMVVALVTSMPPWSIGGIEVGKSRPLGNLTAFFRKSAQREERRLYHARFTFFDCFFSVRKGSSFLLFSFGIFLSVAVLPVSPGERTPVCYCREASEALPP